MISPHFTNHRRQTGWSILEGTLAIILLVSAGIYAGAVIEESTRRSLLHDVMDESIRSIRFKPYALGIEGEPRFAPSTALEFANRIVQQSRTLLLEAGYSDTEFRVEFIVPQEWQRFSLPSVNQGSLISSYQSPILASKPLLAISLKSRFPLISLVNDGFAVIQAERPIIVEEPSL